MAIFLTGDELNAALNNLVRNADKFLYIFSPYIKINKRFKDELLLKKENAVLEIVLVFGKNEDDPLKSISREDIDFLRQFPNIKILYKDTLHAKYYVTEDRAIITSMNLYDYSQTNNVEAAIALTPFSVVKMMVTSTDTEDPYHTSLDYFQSVMQNSKVMYHAEPIFESQLMGLRQRYINSVVRVDEWPGSYSRKKTATTFDANPIKGYCIRTGAEIPFNPEKPMKYEAYQTWAQFGNPDYPEKFCHRTGKPSYGKTSMRKPML